MRHAKVRDVEVEALQGTIEIFTEHQAKWSDEAIAKYRETIDSGFKRLLETFDSREISHGTWDKMASAMDNLTGVNDNG